MTPSKNRGVPHYSFPILSMSELLVCLGELQVPLSEEQLKKPSAEHIRRVFEQLLEFLMGVSHEELSQPVFAAMELLQFPELHEDSISLIAFHRAMQKLMNACGIHDFSMRDYLHPEFQRLRRIFSGIVNFAKFREERMARFEELLAQSETLASNRAQLEEEHATLRAELDKLHAARKAEQPEVDALEEQIAKHAAQMNGMNSTQATLQDELRQLKTANTEISAKLAEATHSVLNEKEEVCKLQAQVVQSPDRVKRDIAEMQENLEREKENVASMNTRTRTLSQRAGGLEQCHAEMTRLAKIMAECEREMTRAKELQDEVHEQHAHQREQHSEMQKLSQAQTHSGRQVRSVEERLQRVKKQTQTRRLDSQSVLEQLQQELQDVEREREAVAQRMVANDAMVAHTSRKIADMKMAHDADMEALRNKYAELESHVVEYHKQLFSALHAVDGVDTN